jgi:hypothetical protein
MPPSSHLHPTPDPLPAQPFKKFTLNFCFLEMGEGEEDHNKMFAKNLKIFLKTFFLLLFFIL